MDGETQAPASADDQAERRAEVFRRRREEAAALRDFGRAAEDAADATFAEALAHLREAAPAPSTPGRKRPVDLRTRAVRQILADGEALERSLAHFGPEPTPHHQAPAERAARSVVAVARLEHTATQRYLAESEMADLLPRSRMLGIVTRRSGIEAAPRRGQRA